ncbi:PAS domain-containing protein [Methylobacterium durans]|uniref:PAS domain-containing protein n=1 Tax=Methylobacterium durans TaxID=2202825 RepID=UPI002AFFEB77|nr:PAS domain-containing protein [Methylobacterium durans]MEA1834769.1 PAS domain-containing protein [Methylobacterium durans]
MGQDEPPQRAMSAALQSALNASGFVGTWETDLSKSTVYPSGSFAGLVGLDVQRAARGVSLAEFLHGIHPEDRERVSSLVHEAHDTAGRFEAEFRTLDLDGLTHWIAARGQVETDAQGKGLRCLGIAVDITDTRQGDGGDSAQTLRTMNQIVEAVISVRRSIGTLGVPVLQTLVDLLLFELGVELSKHVERAQAPQLH